MMLQAGCQLGLHQPGLGAGGSASRKTCSPGYWQQSSVPHCLLTKSLRFSSLDPFPRLRTWQLVPSKARGLRESKWERAQGRKSRVFYNLIWVGPAIASAVRACTRTSPGIVWEMTTQGHGYQEMGTPGAIFEAGCDNFCY